MNELGFVLAIVTPTLAAFLLLLALTGFPFMETTPFDDENEADTDSTTSAVPLDATARQEARGNEVGSAREQLGNTEGTHREARGHTEGTPTEHSRNDHRPFMQRERLIHQSRRHHDINRARARERERSNERAAEP